MFQIEQAIDALGRLGSVRASTLYRTEPVGDAAQPWYVNAVVHIGTELPVEDLFRELRAIERGAGRPERRVSGASRTLDLDLLLYDRLVLDTADLILPHPRMWGRRFVLEPLVEIAPRALDPRSGRSAAAILLALDDPARVEKLPPARNAPGA